MGTHAKMSPSKRARWSRCPASVRAEEAYPDDRSDAAVDGTHTHTLLEWCLTGPDNSIRDPREQIGLTMTDDDGSFVVDGQRVERVQFALNYIMSRKIAIECSKLVSEETLSGQSVFGRDDLGGTVDVQLWGNEVFEVIDYKDGAGVVEAKDNPQLQQYAVLALAPWITSFSALPVKTIRLTIIQPKLRARGMDGIIWTEIAAEDIYGIQMQIMREAAACDSPDAPFVPGDEQCKYCRHRGACTALVERNLSSSGITFDNLAQQAADKEPAALSDSQIKDIIEAAPLIRQMLEGVEKEALRRFNAGQHIAGLKMVRGRGSRSWALEDEQIAEKLKRMGLPKDVVWKTDLISVAQAEKAVWEKKDGTKHQLSERQLKTLQEYIKQSEGKLTIVSESDKRESVSISVAGMFAPVAELPDFLK